MEEKKILENEDLVAANGGASLQLKDIKKEYPGYYERVQGVDLEIQDKEFIVLVGPSGCGKSTTLR